MHIKITIPNDQVRVQDRIIIKNPATKQTEEISVSYTENGPVPTVNPISSLKTEDIILILIVAVVITILLYTMSKEKTTGSSVAAPGPQAHNLSTSGSYGRGILNTTYNSGLDTPNRSGKISIKDRTNVL